MYQVRFRSKAVESRGFEVAEVRGREELSCPYAFEVLIVGAEGAVLDEEAVLSTPASLEFESGAGIVRRIHGVVRRVASELETESGHCSFRLRLEPRIADLELTRTTEIAMDESVPEILEDRLGRVGLTAGADYELRLGESYPAREYVVQFKETHLAFVSRLLEHLGIGYWFEQGEEGEVARFVDANSGFSTSGLRVPLRARGDRRDVYELSRVTTVGTKHVRVRDYNYRTPRVHVTGERGTGGSTGEDYDFGAHAKTPDEAARLAAVRAEELAWQRRVFEGRSARPELHAGMRFTLEGHPEGDRELLVIEVEHELAQATFLASRSTNGPTYANRFRAIDASVSYRPIRRTPKPFVPGALTGLIEAEQEGKYAEVDAHGRYRVRFGFDTTDTPRGKGSRLIRMAQPHAGQGYGFHFPLRDGVEVLLTCVEGDPDRPVISGAVPNPTTPSTVIDRNARRNVIRTGGGTEINIDDTEGSERFKVTVPFANTTFQLGAPNAPVAGVFLGTDKMVHVQSSEGMNLIDETKLTGTAPDVVFMGLSTALIDGASSMTVSSGALVDVHAPTINACADALHATSAPLITEQAGALHTTSAPTIVASAGALWMATSGGLASLHGGAQVSVTGPLVTVSGATIKVSGDTVTISGASVAITGSGAVNVNGPSVNIRGGVVDVHGGPIKLNC